MPPKSANKTESQVKKNKSSYMFFCIDERMKVKSDNSTLNNKEILSELGKRWKKLKEENINIFKYYEKLASDDKERYLNEKNNPSEINTYKIEEDFEVDNEEDVKINGYVNYCKKNRQFIKDKNKELSPKEVTNKLSENWKNLTNEEKKEYFFKN